MKEIIREEIFWKKFEIEIDTKIYNKDIILKAAYNFLDRGYFYFEVNDAWNILLQFTKRDDINIDPKDILWDFLDELLSVELRDKLEKENKSIREWIIATAISNSLDINNFGTIDTSNNEEQNQIDFDKDIDDILKEIENDPDLKIDETEIENILKEIEEETSSEQTTPVITLDKEGLKKAKENFKK